MRVAKSALKIAVIAAAGAAVSPPAAAQLTASPDPWTVEPDPARASVYVKKTATDGRTLFVAGCDQQRGPGFIGSLLNYGGMALEPYDGSTERVLFEVRGEDWKEAFAVQLRYGLRNRAWTIVETIAPVFVASFSRGQTLTIINSQRQQVASFDLTGSTAAARAMRTTCGFQ